MIDYQQLRRVAAEEIRIDVRRIGAHAVSRAFPYHSFSRIRTSLLRLLGYRLGKRSLLMGPLTVTGFNDVRRSLRFGEDCYITGPLHVDLMADVSIGAGVVMGYDVRLITADHELGSADHRCGPIWSAAIEIGDGVWIGSNVVVLAGVQIGKGAVIGSGAVVTKDVAANTMVAGVPARFMRDLGEEVPPPSVRQVRCQSQPWALRPDAPVIPQARARSR
jgi:acetyltransferase-like isoleucine patch superfamily enzyme